MYRIILILSFLNKKMRLLITAAILVAFAAVSIIGLMRIDRLQHDVVAYEEQIVVLNERMRSYETAAQRNVELTEQNNDLRTRNDELTLSNSELIAANGELGRLNGDLSKKYDGLSKPN